MFHSRSLVAASGEAPGLQLLTLGEQTWTLQLFTEWHFHLVVQVQTESHLARRTQGPRALLSKSPVDDLLGLGI